MGQKQVVSCCRSVPHASGSTLRLVCQVQVGEIYNETTRPGQHTHTISQEFDICVTFTSQAITAEGQHMSHPEQQQHSTSRRGPIMPTPNQEQSMYSCSPVHAVCRMGPGTGQHCQPAPTATDALLGSDVIIGGPSWMTLVSIHDSMFSLCLPPSD